MKLPGDNVILEIKEFPKYPNEIDMEFGYLRILYEIECDDIPGVVYMLRCKCGKEVLRRRANLYQNSKSIQSCGCYNNTFGKNFKHGYSRDKKRNRLHVIWDGMRQRCDKPDNRDYHNYGGRGIKICNEWMKFKSFQKWAMRNGYKKNLTIERKDVNLGYSPENCIWIPKKEQSRNRRSNSRFLIDGEWILQKDLAIKLGVSESKIKAMAIDGRLKFESWDKSSRLRMSI